MVGGRPSKFAIANVVATPLMNLLFAPALAYVLRMRAD
jgi:hypothetical protein